MTSRTPHLEQCLARRKLILAERMNGKFSIDENCQAPTIMSGCLVHIVHVMSPSGVSSLSSWEPPVPSVPGFVFACLPCPGASSYFRCSEVRGCIVYSTQLQ